MSVSQTADQPDVLQFEDNSVLPMLFGEHDQNLARIERQLGVSLACRGNQVAISGPPDAVRNARAALTALYDRLLKGLGVGDGEVDAVVRLARSEADPDQGAAADAIHAEHLTIRTRRRHISPRSAGQAAYIDALMRHELVFGLGPAGTGKTYLAVAMAVSLLMSGKVDRLIVSRPAVEAGERLGFLPGDLRDKVDPYLRPLYDALYDMLPADQVMNRLSSGEIEVAPLAFMRGRTLSNAFVILDEAQNTTPVQMKMFLTRFGENSRMAITGDLSQIDLPHGQPSGLRDAVELLGDLDEVAFVRFTDADVVRHALVTRIVRAYDARDRKRGDKGR
ncbi:MAG: PhoH family protein [Kiloniellales bacterium]|nr:PhoH family protein [Kiloniellales bacterium]